MTDKERISALKKQLAFALEQNDQLTHENILVVEENVKLKKQVDYIELEARRDERDEQAKIQFKLDESVKAAGRAQQEKARLSKLNKKFETQITSLKLQTDKAKKHSAKSAQELIKVKDELKSVKKDNIQWKNQNQKLEAQVKNLKQQNLKTNAYKEKSEALKHELDSLKSARRTER